MKACSQPGMEPPGVARRFYAVVGAIVLATWAVLGTEVLGLFGAFAAVPIALFWLSSFALLLFVCRRSGLIATDWGRQRQLKAISQSVSPFEWTLLAFIGLLLTTAFLAGVLSIPSNWDSLVIHLPRQVRWIQQQSVAHFPTHVPTQLHREPFAEMAGAHVMALSSSDRFSFALQWGALAMAAVAVSLIARECGAQRGGQLLAALIAMTYPVAFLQASNQKTDLVFAMWFCILAFLVCRLWNAPRWNGKWTVLLGSTVGLLMLTKGTAYFIGLPLYALTAAGFWRRFRWRGAISGLVIISMAALLTAGHYSRNWGLYGHPIGPAHDMADFGNHVLTPAAAISRVIREAGLHVATPFPRLNRASLAAISQIHRWLDYDLNDPATSSKPFFVVYTPGDENMAQAPVHLLMGLALPVLAFCWRREIRVRFFWILLAVPYLSFVFVSVFLKWNFTYGVRVHMGVFFLWGAFAGVLFGIKKARFAAPVLVALLAVQLAPAFWLNPRSLFPGRGMNLPESEQLLISNPGFRDPAVGLSILDVLAEAKRAKPLVVGLMGEPEWFEYVVMRSLSGGNPVHPLFVSTNPPLPAGGRAHRPVTDYLPPDLIVAGPSVSSLVDQQTGRLYQAVGPSGRLTLLLPTPTDAGTDAGR